MSAHVKDRFNLKSIALQTEVSGKNDSKMFIRGYCFRDISFYKIEIRVISKVHPGLRTLQGGAYTTADLFCGTRFPQRLENCLV